MTAVLKGEGAARSIADFRGEAYLRINQRRLEHLATLGLPLHGRRVLELGAGIGDLTGFFVDRGCPVLALEGRSANASVLASRFADEPGVEVREADLNEPPALESRFGVVFAYGVLYHLADPGRCLEWMGACAAEDGLIVLSTCVTAPGACGEDPVHPTTEDASYASQALDGRGCRPSRAWVYERLRALMPFVYTTRTQPNHDEYPLDWRSPAPSRSGLLRAVFVASRHPLASPALHAGLVDVHERGG